MSEPELRELLDLAARAARLGGEVARRAAAAPDVGHGVGGVEEKGAGDYVTEVDRASEDAISAALLEARPGIPVLGEESGGEPGERYWSVDPLDGTTNFLHGFRAVGVSVALVEAGRPVIGVVHGPFLGETYLAARGLGARLLREGVPEPVELRVSSRPAERAVVGTGFPFRRKGELLDRYLGVFGAALERFEDLRRPGAAALDLAWVASGVFDGFFELGLSAWDVAAGAVLIEEAGGIVTDWAGGDGYLSGDVLAGPAPIHAELLRLAAGVG